MDAAGAATLAVWGAMFLAGSRGTGQPSLDDTTGMGTSPSAGFSEKSHFLISCNSEELTESVKLEPEVRKAARNLAYDMEILVRAMDSVLAEQNMPGLSYNYHDKPLAGTEHALVATRNYYGDNSRTIQNAVTFSPIRGAPEDRFTALSFTEVRIGGDDKRVTIARRQNIAKEGTEEFEDQYAAVAEINLRDGEIRLAEGTDLKALLQSAQEAVNEGLQVCLQNGALDPGFVNFFAERLAGNTATAAELRTRFRALDTPFPSDLVESMFERKETENFSQMADLIEDFGAAITTLEKARNDSESFETTLGNKWSAEYLNGKWSFHKEGFETPVVVETRLPHDCDIFLGVYRAVELDLEYHGRSEGNLMLNREILTELNAALLEKR